MRGPFFRRFFTTTGLIGLILGIGLPLQMVQAAVKKPVSVTHAASVLTLAVPRVLKPGEVDQVRVTIKNLGTATWKRDGKNYVSLYRWNPTTKKEVASAFARPSWETTLRPTRLPVSTVSPNGEVSFAFPVRAPDRAGIYREQFILASEGVAWIARSAFDVELTVVAGANAPAPVPTPVSATLLPVLTLSAFVSEASLPSSSEWRAELIDKGGIEWQVEPADRTIAEVTFRNTGSTTWRRETGPFVSVYAVDASGKKERATSFVAGTDPKKPVARLLEEQVTPGNIGHFKLQLRGPAVSGFYRESFALAAENQAWIEGGQFLLPIRVPGRDEFVGTAPPETQPLSPTANVITRTSGTAANNLYAVLASRSGGEVSGGGYTQKEFVVSFKNVSTVTWNNPSIRFIDLRRPVYANDSSLQDVSWSNANEAVRLLGTTRPQDLTSLAFTFRLPANQGAYTALFQLYVNDKPVQGGIVEIPLMVTSNAANRTPRVPVPTSVSRSTRPSVPITPVVTRPPIEAIPLNGDVNLLPAEPMIRVGLLRTLDSRSVIQAMSVPVLVQQAGSTVCRLSAGQQASVAYDRTSRVYILGEACSGQSSTQYVFKAEDNLSPMRVTDYGRNDNTFRAQLELRYTPATDSVWLINELPIEWYLKGIAETSNVSPMEFKRTLLTTARTYAMYHVQRGTKHADEFYTVDARYDQVYRGYGHELRAPTIAQAVDATRGQIVTYQGRLAITPYFSRSDGRTRGWGEVWGGASSYPWIVSVPVPQDIGRTLWGHGVGMSATGALDMANEGRSYEEILKHFYQGIELRRAYR